MLLILFVSKIFGSVNQFLEPGESIHFKEMMTEEDQQLFIKVTNLTKNKFLNSTFITPDKGTNYKKKQEENDYSSEYSYESSEFDYGMNQMVSTEVKKTFYKPGMYQLILENVGDKIIEYSLFSSASPKINKSKN